MKKSRQNPTIERLRHSMSYLGMLVIILGSILIVSCDSTPEQELPSVLPWSSATPPNSNEGTLPSTADAVLTTVEPDADGVEFLGASLGSDGRFVVLYFKGTPEVIQSWWEGSVYVVDEATGILYYDIPTAPVVGPLFAKPIEAGQVGYVMLDNTNYSLKTGSIITVVLGKYKRQHIQMK